MASSKAESSGSSSRATASTTSPSGSVASNNTDVSSGSPTGVSKTSYASILRAKNENSLKLTNGYADLHNQANENVHSGGSSGEGSVGETVSLPAKQIATKDRRIDQEKVQKTVRANKSKGRNHGTGRENAKQHDGEQLNYRAHNGSSSSSSFEGSHYHENSRYQNGRYSKSQKHPYSGDDGGSYYKGSQRNHVTGPTRDEYNRYPTAGHSQENSNTVVEKEEGELTDDDDFETVVRKRHSSHANSQKYRNGSGGGMDSGKGKEFKTTRGRRSFRDGDRRKIDQRGGRRYQEDRDRDKPTTLSNSSTLPSHHQQQSQAGGISSTSISHSITSSNHTVTTNGINASGGVANGSVCSETSSISVGSSSGSNNIICQGGRSRIESTLAEGSSLSCHVRHNSGDRSSVVSGSASTCETSENVHSEIAQNSSEESNKPHFVLAPPPAVNPWRVNPNAASVIAKKSPSSQEGLSSRPAPSAVLNKIPTPTPSLPEPIPLQLPAAALVKVAQNHTVVKPQQPHKGERDGESNSELKGTDKDKTNNTNATVVKSSNRGGTATNINKSNSITISPSNSANSQSQGGVKSSSTVIPTTAAKIVKPIAIKTSEISAAAIPQSTSLDTQSSPRKDLPVPEVPIRRAFAAVAKNQKVVGIHGGSGKQPVIQEDWPSLPSGPAPSSGTNSPSIALSKPVISSIVTKEDGKMDRGKTAANVESVTASTMPDTEDKTLQLTRKLPEDNWPSITADTNGKKEPNGRLLSGSSPAGDEKEEGEVSDSEDEETTVETVKGILTPPETPTLTRTDKQKMSENGSLCSSEYSVENELDSELAAAGGRKGKNGKKTKQKWVPLSLPETPSAKSRSRRDRNSVEKELDKENKENSNQHNPSYRYKGKIPLNNNKEVDGTNGPVNAEGRSNHNNNHVYVPRGRGRSSGNRGRGSRSGRGAYHQAWSTYEDAPLMDPAVTSTGTRGDEYADYPADYTTLPPMYPVTEFIMPYVTNYSYPAVFAQPSGTLVDESLFSVGYFPPPDEATLTQMIRMQIEYYFSEENLSKDLFLRKKMDEDGWISVRTIASFPRIKTMTLDYTILIQAIQSLPQLELKDDFVRMVNEPKKWPIDDAMYSAMKAKLAPLYLHYTPSHITYQQHQQTNGYMALSPPLTADSTLNNNNSSSFITFTSIADKLNPNVPEFVPKSKLLLNSS